MNLFWRFIALRHSTGNKNWLNNFLSVERNCGNCPENRQRSSCTLSSTMEIEDASSVGKDPFTLHPCVPNLLLRMSAVAIERRPHVAEVNHYQRPWTLLTLLSDTTEAASRMEFYLQKLTDNEAKHMRGSAEELKTRSQSFE